LVVEGAAEFRNQDGRAEGLVLVDRMRQKVNPKGPPAPHEFPAASKKVEAQDGEPRARAAAGLLVRQDASAAENDARASLNILKDGRLCVRKCDSSFCRGRASISVVRKK